MRCASALASGLRTLQNREAGSKISLNVSPPRPIWLVFVLPPEFIQP
jgi:hypothetical protein